MKYHDFVYGEVEINDPVVLKLIKSSSLQRLKGINQAGYRPLWVNPNVKTEDSQSNRFCHSVGVYLLLKKFHAPFEEQIAGLIHDISHTAFSHCGDYVLKSGSGKEQNHQDCVFYEFVNKSEASIIIKKHGLDLEYLLEESNFPLKEKKLPDLCADRIDYSLRDSLVHEVLTRKETDNFFEEFTDKRSKLGF